MKYISIKGIAGKALMVIALVCGAISLKAQKLSTGWNKVMYICPDSTISAIGSNGGYTLGDGTDINRYIPVKVKGLHSVVAVNAYGSLALLKDGTVWQWARKHNYSLKMINIDSVIAISSGTDNGSNNFYCALKSDGSLWLWGDRDRKSENSWGYTDSLERMNIPKVKKVQGGWGCVIALCEDGSVWTWGSSDVAGNGIPMENYPNELPNPQKVQSLSNVVDIGAGGIWISAWALKDDGTVWEWGWINGAYTPRSMNISDVKKIYINSDGFLQSFFALKNNGSLLCINDLFHPNNTCTIDYIKGIEHVAACGGEYSVPATYVLDSTNNLWRWGDNEYGQLGTFTTYPIDTPEVMPHKCMAVNCDTITKNPDVLVLDTTVRRGDPVTLKTSLSESDLYWWYPQSNVVSGKYAQEATVKIMEDTEFNAVVMDSYGCMRKERFLLRKKCPPLRTVVDTVTYPGAKIPLEAGNGEFYFWNPYQNLSSNCCRNTIAYITEPVTYTCTYTDSIGCQVQEEFVIRIRNCDTIPRSSGLDTLITPGSYTTLTTPSAIAYSWTPSEGLSCNDCQSPTARIYANTEYVATMMDKLRCQWTERFKLTNKCDNSTLSTPRVVMDTVTYPQAKLNFTQPDGREYTWQPTTGLSCGSCKSPTATITNPIEYSVSMVDSFYCASKAKYNIRIRDCDTIVIFKDRLVTDALITPGSSNTLNASNAMAYSWTPSEGLSCNDCQSPTARIYANTEYVATMMDKLRCQWTERFKLTNKCDNSTLSTPRVVMDTVTYPQAQLSFTQPDGRGVHLATHDRVKLRQLQEPNGNRY